MGWKEFFYIFGLSCKPFNYDKGIRGNGLALWSATVNVVLLIIVIVEAIFDKLFPSYMNENILSHLILLFFSTTASVILISTRFNESNENEFWELHNKMSRNPRKYKPTRSLKFNMSLELVDLAINLLGVIVLTITAGLYIGILKIGRYYPCHIAYKVSIMKFCYFMDVLAFQLDELRSLVILDKKKESAKQMKNCWRMRELINQIFGWPLMFNCGMLIVAAVSSLHLNYEKPELNQFSFSVIFAYIAVFNVAYTCQKISTKYTAIKALLFAKAKHCNEMLILQMIHQNLEVSPMKIFRTNHEFIISVGII